MEKVQFYFTEMLGNKLKKKLKLKLEVAQIFSLNYTEWTYFKKALPEHRLHKNISVVQPQKKKTLHSL